MSKIINKTICVLLVLALNISMPHIYAADTQKDNSTGILVRMGIIDSDFAMSDDVVTRGKFAEILCNILVWNNLDKRVPATKQIFTDVSQWDWIAEYLEFLSNRGIISGYDDGSFRPNEPMDLCSAYSMMLNVLEYREFVKFNGDYPASVMEVANITELDYGFDSYSCSEKLTAEMTAKLLDNMVRTKMMKFKGKTTNGNTSFSTDKTFLNAYMNIYEYEGIITGAGGKSISGNIIPADKVEIDGNIYNNMAGNISDVLGCSTTYYLEQSDDGFDDTVWAVIPDKNNNILELDADLVYSYENSEVVYYENGRERTAEVDLKADILKNAEMISRYYTYVPDYGSIRLVDNDDDRTYDVVIISDYDAIVVSNVDTERGIIYGKNTDSSGNLYKIDTTEFEYSSILDSSYNTVDIKALKQNGVLTGEITEDKYLRLIYCEQTLTGKVTSLDYDDPDVMRVTIGDLVYKVINNVYSPKEKLSAGMSCDFLLDYKGNIAAVINVTGNQWSYGYLISAGRNEENDSIVLRMLTQAGQVEWLECSDNFRLDSIPVVNKEEAISTLKTKQLVRYRMKKEQIGAVDTATDQAADNLVKSSEDSYNSLLRRGDATLTYRPTLNIFKRPSEAPPLPALDCEISIAADTVIFRVPENPDTAREWDYKIIQRSSLADGDECRVESFNTTGDELRVEAVVMHSDETPIKLQARPFIVKEISQILNSDGEVTYKLKGYASGGEVERTLKTADLLTKTKNKVTHTIERGDVLRTRQNSDGYTTNVEIIYTVSDDFGSLNKKSLFGSNGTTHGAILRCAYGKVTYRNDEVFALTREKDEFSKITELHPIKGFTIYVCDMTGENPEVYMGTAADIPNVIAGEESEEEIIICTSQASPRDLIVIKK